MWRAGIASLPSCLPYRFQRSCKCMLTKRWFTFWMGGTLWIAIAMTVWAPVWLIFVSLIMALVHHAILAVSMSHKKLGDWMADDWQAGDWQHWQLHNIVRCGKLILTNRKEPN